MAFESLVQAGFGGTGIPNLGKILTELQGLQIKVLAGATSGTKIDVPALRQEDQIVAVLEFEAGVPVDRLGVTSVVDCHAFGTVTAASAAVADTVTVNGKVFTFVATGAVANKLTNQVNLGSTDTITAANLVSAINKSMLADKVVASNVGAVVTIKANVEGTAGNAYTLASSNNTRLAVSGATLANGTATGGIKIANDTSSNAVVLVYFNKK